LLLCSGFAAELAKLAGCAGCEVVAEEGDHAASDKGL
jgi:hypothetical protein